MRKLNSIKSIILTGMLCFLAPAAVFGANERAWNDALRASGPVYLRIKEGAYEAERPTAASNTALDKNSQPFKDIDVRLFLSSPESSYWRSYEPSKLQEGAFKFVGLNAKNGTSTIEVNVPGYKVTPDSFAIGNNDHLATATAKSTDGTEYEIGISFKVDEGTWMLYPDPYEPTLAPAKAYLVGVDYVKKLSTSPTTPLGDIKPAADKVQPLTQEQIYVNDYMRNPGPVYFRIKELPTGNPTSTLYTAVDINSVPLTIEGKDVELIFTDPLQYTGAGSYWYDYNPKNRVHGAYKFVGYNPENGLGTVSISGDNWTKPIIFQVGGGDQTATITTTDGGVYEIGISNKVDEGTWMLYADSFNPAPAKAYLVGVDYVKNLTPPDVLRPSEENIANALLGHARPVYFRIQQSPNFKATPPSNGESYTAVKENSEVWKIEKNDVQLVFLNPVEDKYGPAKIIDSTGKYKFVGRSSNIPAGAVSLKVAGATKIEPASINIDGSSGTKEFTVTTKNAQYKVGVNFKPEEGTWMLYPSPVKLDPIKYYLISVDSVNVVYPSIKPSGSGSTRI